MNFEDVVRRALMELPPDDYEKCLGKLKFSHRYVVVNEMVVPVLLSWILNSYEANGPAGVRYIIATYSDASLEEWIFLNGIDENAYIRANFKDC